MIDFIQLAEWLKGEQKNILTALAWFVSITVTYYFTKRSKADEIIIKKRLEISEKLAIFLEKDYQDRQLFREYYKTNFAHLSGRHEAVQVFEKYDDLYRELRTLMANIPTNIDNLISTNREALIYIDKKIIDDIQKYIKYTKFYYDTDGAGFFNNYAEKAFDNLLDKNNIEEMHILYKRIMKKLITKA